MRASLVSKMRSPKYVNGKKLEYWKLQLRGENNELILLNTTSEFFRDVMFDDTINVDFKIKKTVGNIIYANSPKNLEVLVRGDLYKQQTKGEQNEN